MEMWKQIKVAPASGPLVTPREEIAKTATQYRRSSSSTIRLLLYRIVRCLVLKYAQLCVCTYRVTPWFLAIHWTKLVLLPDTKLSCTKMETIAVLTMCYPLHSEKYQFLSPITVHAAAPQELPVSPQGKKCVVACFIWKRNSFKKPWWLRSTFPTIDRREAPVILEICGIIVWQRAI